MKERTDYHQFTIEEIQVTQKALGSRYTLVVFMRFETRDLAQYYSPHGVSVCDGPFTVVKRGGSTDPHYLVVYDHHSNEN